MASCWIVASAIGLGFGACARADAPTADQVIAKCLASYDAVKTYSGSLDIRIERGDTKTRITMDLKAENGDKGMIARSAIHLTQSTSAPSGSTEAETLVIDNGTTVFTVDTKSKAYWEQPHGGDRVSGMFRRLLENAKSNVSKLKVTQERLKDRPIYRIAGSGVSGAVSIAIDRETSQIYTAEGSGGAGASKFRSELTASNQKFNKPLDASAFKWTPPAGFVKRESGEAKP